MAANCRPLRQLRGLIIKTHVAFIQHNRRESLDKEDPGLIPHEPP
jgi:hypothetical protein